MMCSDHDITHECTMISCQLHIILLDLRHHCNQHQDIHFLTHCEIEWNYGYRDSQVALVNIQAPLNYSPLDASGSIARRQSIRWHQEAQHEFILF